MNLLDIATAMDKYGPVVVVVSALLLINSFFIWRDYKREQTQQAQMQQIVIPLLVECKEAIAICKEVIGQNSQIIGNWMTGRGGS